MKTKTTLILLFVTTLFFGQNQQTGEIVISKPHLISLLQKFKTSNNPVADQKVVLSPLILENKSVSNDSVWQRLHTLETEIAALRVKRDTVIKQIIVRDTIYKSGLKTAVVRDTIYKTTTGNTQKAVLVADKNYEEQLNVLHTKYDALLRNQEKLLALQTVSAVAVPAAVAVISNDNTKANDQVLAVSAVKPVSDLVEVADPLIIDGTKAELKPSAKLVSAIGILKEKYEKRQAQVFFANNATTIEQGDALRLTQIVKELNNTPSLLVYLEGFSSNKGNAGYNDKLSLLRNDAVKQFLIENGISPKRILSQHHGVDMGSATQAMARRVDVSFVVNE